MLGKWGEGCQWEKNQVADIAPSPLPREASIFDPTSKSKFGVLKHPNFSRFLLPPMIGLKELVRRSLGKASIVSIGYHFELMRWLSLPAEFCHHLLLLDVCPFSSSAPLFLPPFVSTTSVVTLFPSSSSLAKADLSIAFSPIRT